MSRSSCVARAREARRAQICSSKRFSRKASGSSSTMGYSNSMASSNTGGASTGTSVREAVPRASCCKRKPSCPRRSLSATSGSAASACKLRTAPAVESFEQAGRFFFFLFAFFSRAVRQIKLPSAASPSCSASLPAGITVTPEKPRAASTAASGLEATATFASSPRLQRGWKMARAISRQRAEKRFHASEIENCRVGRGIFHAGRKRLGTIEQCGVRGRFLQRRTRAQA